MPFMWTSAQFDQGRTPRCPSATSMTTGGAAEDLARSSGEALDSFNKGEVRGFGVPHPFWGVVIGVLAGCLKKG